MSLFLCPKIEEILIFTIMKPKIIKKSNTKNGRFNDIEQTENKTYLEKSIISYRKERAAGYLSSENFSADDLLDATVARVGTFPSCIGGSKSTIALTIREIHEEKKINYYLP